MKKLTIKYLAAAGLMSTTMLFAGNLSNQESFAAGVGVGAVASAVLGSILETDRYYDKPVYLYNDRYYYGGEYRNGYYYHNGHRLNGGQYYNRARFYDHDQPRRIIVNNYDGYGIFVTDRYYNKPAYFYNGRYYYGGEYRNGYYYHNGRRLHDGRFFSSPRKVHHRHYAERGDVRVYQNEDRRDRDFRRDDRDGQRDRDFRRDDRDGQRDRDYR